MQNKNLFLIMFIFISTYAMDNKQEEKDPYWPPSAAVEIDPIKESIEKHAYNDWKRKGDHLASYFTSIEKPELVYDEWQMKKDAPFRGSHAYNIALSQTRARYEGAAQSEKSGEAIDEKTDENKK